MLSFIGQFFNSAILPLLITSVFFTLEFSGEREGEKGSNFLNLGPYFFAGEGAEIVSVMLIGAFS
jgi:hypothetical protein